MRPVQRSQQQHSQPDSPTYRGTKYVWKIPFILSWPCQLLRARAFQVQNKHLQFSWSQWEPRHTMVMRAMQTVIGAPWCHILKCEQLHGSRAAQPENKLRFSHRLHPMGLELSFSIQLIIFFLFISDCYISCYIIWRHGDVWILEFSLQTTTAHLLAWVCST